MTQPRKPMRPEVAAALEKVLEQHADVFAALEAYEEIDKTLEPE